MADAIFEIEGKYLKFSSYFKENPDETKLFSQIQIVFIVGCGRSGTSLIS